MLGRGWRWLRGLSWPALAVLGAGVLTVAGAVAYYGYRAYEYVEHDNEFCLGCHLMEEPYERFARSEHRDLGCKSCHKPTLAARSRMALTQVIASPDELKAHAEVPDAKCEACHVKGDPAKWEQIANTAGHRVHLESDDPDLRKVTCVQCHSTSVHEFAATDRTCAQSGCHEGTDIKLGKMSQLTLHCALCHDFKREVTQEMVPSDSLEHALAPKARECLSCHQMRRLVADEFTSNDPHDAQCAHCHNPHQQATPRDAVQTCNNCHQSADTLTPMHRGLRAGVLQQCTECHQAHKFQPPPNGCSGCHQQLDSAAAPSLTRVALQQPQDDFSHGVHETVTCQSCHNSTRRHGEVTVRSARDCQSCHHRGAPAANCAACHASGEYANRLFPILQRMTFSVGQPRVKTRTVNFDHRRHAGVSCTQCHREPVTRAANDIQCNACHQDHHKATESCTSCHQARRESPHTVKVHVGCGGSGCHEQVPVAGVPRTRQFCLTCHQNMTSHRPSGNCADCHRLPTPRA